MAFHDGFVIHNKFFFFSGFLIFTAAAYYSTAKNDNSIYAILATLLGVILLVLSRRKPKGNKE